MNERTEYCGRSSSCETRKSQAEGDYTDEFLDDEGFEDDDNDKVE
ncbi:MAG: hypothetical protein WA220_05230 [Candidatus Nitrosopolaris sp.]